MKTAIYGSIATLVTASLIALASLYVQVQVLENDIQHLTVEVQRLRQYFVSN